METTSSMGRKVKLPPLFPLNQIHCKPTVHAQTCTMMGISPLRFAQLLLCLQLIVDRASADESNRLRIRDLQLEDDTPQTIVGGELANPADYPAFTFFANGECAGTLISPTRVLTAAHCVKSGHPASVRVGATNRTDGKEVKVRCAKSHPLYDWPNFQYDIAVLKLDESVNGINFPTLNPFLDYPSVEGQTLTVIGLGKNATAGYVADHLMKVDYAFVPDAQCKSTYGEEVTQGLHVCAKGIRQGGECLLEDGMTER